MCDFEAHGATAEEVLRSVRSMVGLHTAFRNLLPTVVLVLAAIRDPRGARSTLSRRLSRPQCWVRIRQYQQFNIELLLGCLELLMLVFTE